MSESTPNPTTGGSPSSGLPRQGWLLLVIGVGAVLIGLVALALVVLLGLRGVLSRGEANPGMPLEVVKLTPAYSTSPLLPPSCETIISSGDVQVAVSIPISLTVGSRPFPIVAVVPQEGGWTYPPGQSGLATWMCGTVVNYVVGLEPTPQNEALLAGLRPGDEIKMRLSSGAVLFFRFVEQREVMASEAGIFEQVRPRLTLIVEREAGSWQVATSDYVAESEPVQPPVGALVQPGQPVRVGDVQVTVTRGYVERSGPDLLPETMYYLVEFSIENMGSVPLDGTVFNMQLRDRVGNGYLLSPAASASGEHGPLGGEIAPGVSAQGTAGYLVPQTLAGPTLIWTFSPRPGSQLRASVGIPYDPGLGPAPAGHAEVSITDAFLSSDGDVLFIEGEVRNTGRELLTVELGDISLTSSAGMSDLRVAAPPLPWTVQPGQTQVIELQYTKPAASAALLGLLGYSFEIQGLQ
jgi:hypothetical protein